MSKKFLLVGVVVFGVIAFFAYKLETSAKLNKPAGELNVPGTAIANPASEFCIDNGGALDTRNFSDGQWGFCVFDDESECDEWKFFRGECKKGDNICKNLCGDGICQEIVCMGQGCPCAETPANCAKDCSQS